VVKKLLTNVINNGILNKDKGVMFMKGKVKWWNDHKGLGFLTGEDGEDYFAHFTELPNNDICLEEGWDVDFQVRDGHRGPQAVKIRLCESKREETDIEKGENELEYFIKFYKKSSDYLAQFLDSSDMDQELKERIESFCLSYDEHLMLNTLMKKARGDAE
jgi:cold shock protein